MPVFLWFVPLFLIFAAPMYCQTTGTAAQARSFRIGYLRGDPESQLHGGAFSAFRDYLLDRPGARSAMHQEQVTGIDVWASDSHQDLIQRMDQNEFDLVFCSSVDFVLQKGAYDAILQLRHREGRFDAAGRAVFDQGVVFVNNRSRLFGEMFNGADLAAYLQAHQIAMVNSFSAAGYVYPTLRVATLTSHTLTPAPLFCNSSEEVVKYVINGVTEIGACEAGVIDKVLESNGFSVKDRDKLVRVILKTDPIPTDPVVLHQRWSPRSSAFGREVRDELRQFFARSEDWLPRLESSSNDRYEDVRRNMEILRGLR